MKTKTILTLLTVIVILSFSCKNQKDNPFSVELTYDQNTISLNDTSAIVVEITPNFEDREKRYYMSYQLKDGEGKIKNLENTIFEPGSQITIGGIENLLSKYYFVPAKNGTVNLELTFWDNDDHQVIKNIVYTCDYYQSDFLFTCEAESEDALVDSSVAINFSLTELLKMDVNYTLSFETSGEGTVNYEGIVYSDGESIDINPGEFTILYTGNSQAVHDITFTITNDNHTPQSRTADVSIDYAYYQSDFTFTATPEDNYILVDTAMLIEFNLTEILKKDVAYNMYFTCDKQGSVEYNGTTYTQDQAIPFEPGESTGYYIAAEEGFHHLTFMVINDNQYPQSHTDNIIFSASWYQSDFSFSAVPSAINANVGDSIDISLILYEYLKEMSTVNYTMSFTVSSELGTFTYNGITYPQGPTEDIPIEVGNSQGKYVGLTSGLHHLIFTVLNDNHYPIAHSFDFDITFN